MIHIERIRRNIIVVDLKSFFASCECVERGLNPFTTPLVVAGSNKGAITLAVTPYLKKQGIKGRTRLYEIPSHIKYIKVPPRMNLYIKKSKEVVDIYMDFVAPEDIHIYSIDECFLDLTNYLKLYQKTDYEIAEDILKTIEQKTGLTATCGIGPNMLIAKVAMDTEAKKYKNGICKWTYDDVKEKFATITPLSKFWGIGPRMETKLNRLGINSIGDLQKYDPHKLKNLYGVIGYELWEHANGIDNTKISDINNYQAKDKSFSHSQVLFKDYHGDNVKIIIKEMIEVLTARLRSNNVVGKVIGFGLSYSKQEYGGFYHSIKLDNSTDKDDIIYTECLLIMDKFYHDEAIRKVSISIGGLEEKTSEQLNLFEDFSETKKTDDLMETIDTIKKRFGKNSLLKGTSLLNDSTAIERNKKIGGHHE